ncbi:MAG: nuclear transport factor 2 family protein [Pseudonocardiaceae bacterium]
MMIEAPGAVVATYFRAWKAGDLDTLRSVLADDATFVGPLGSADNADAYREGMEGLSKITTDIVIHKTFVDGPDVLTWFDLHTSVAPLGPVANFSHVENGKITSVRVTFDPRPLTAQAS